MKKYLIVGLGNMGSEYHNTRHNIGFKILNFIAKSEQVEFAAKKFGEIASFKFKGRTFIMLKPSTYMNLSGKAVNYWLQKERIPLRNLLIIIDDISLSFGTIRIKEKGSDGGHNGLKSIQTILGTHGYPRFRFGIGNAFSKGKQVEYVLGEWTSDEKEQLQLILSKMPKIIKSFGTQGIQRTMNTYNGKLHEY